MARRLFVVGIFILIDRGSITQLIIATIFSAAYLLLQVQAAPYREMDLEANGGIMPQKTVLSENICFCLIKVSRQPSARLQPTRPFSRLSSVC